MKPNILFLMTDEQRADTLSYCNKIMKTPNLDALMKDSICFCNAHSSNPSCIPSRAAIVTGKYPTACACPTFITRLPKEETTFMNKLQNAGYYTAVIGKQHFANSGIEHGYDEEMISDSLMPKKKPYAEYYDFLQKEGVLDKQLCTDDLIMGGSWCNDIKYHIDHFIGERAKEWLNNRLNKEQTQPWFLTVSFPGPHMPYNCEGTEFADLYKLEDMNLPETDYDDLKQKPAYYDQIKDEAHINRYSDETFRKTKRAYYANVSLIDKKIGEIIDILKEKGEYDNTLIFFTADHGDFMGDFGLVAKGQYLSEVLMRVPLLVKPPIADFKGRIQEDYINNINIASTCLKIADAEESITADMENEPYTNYFYDENYHTENEYLYMEAHNVKGVIFKGYKVLYYVDRPYGELYNLTEDPHEKHNLWDDASYRDIREKGIRKITDKLFSMSPKSSAKWNKNDPMI